METSGSSFSQPAEHARVCFFFIVTLDYLPMHRMSLMSFFLEIMHPAGAGVGEGAPVMRHSRGVTCTRAMVNSSLLWLLWCMVYCCCIERLACNRSMQISQ